MLLRCHGRNAQSAPSLWLKPLLLVGNNNINREETSFNTEAMFCSCSELQLASCQQPYVSWQKCPERPGPTVLRGCYIWFSARPNVRPLPVGARHGNCAARPASQCCAPGAGWLLMCWQSLFLCLLFLSCRQMTLNNFNWGLTMMPLANASRYPYGV